MSGKDLNRSIKQAAPLGPIAKKDRKAFIEQMTDREYETFQRAQRWYLDTFVGG